MKELTNSAISNCYQYDTYFKFLSANDSGETGGHQAGILISSKYPQFLFREGEKIKEKDTPKRDVKIIWNDDIIINNKFTWYQSKKELRITNFERKHILCPELTGSLFLLLKIDYDNYLAYIISEEDEINVFLETFGLSPSNSGLLYNGTLIPDSPFFKGELSINKIIWNFMKEKNIDDFPSTFEMSYYARELCPKISLTNPHNPDALLVEWTKAEYSLFREIEHSKYCKKFKEATPFIDTYIAIAQEILQRRKSRAGKSLEHHAAELFKQNHILFDAQKITEGNKKPDFIFPSIDAYHNPSYPTDRIISLAAKTTCKDRWRQILNESDRLRDRPKFLLTLQQGISSNQLEEMRNEKVVLVVPRQYISYYPKPYQEDIYTIRKFINYVREKESIC